MFFYFYLISTYFLKKRQNSFDILMSFFRPTFISMKTSDSDLKVNRNFLSRRKIPFFYRENTTKWGTFVLLLKKTGAHTFNIAVVSTCGLCDCMSTFGNFVHMSF